MKIERFPLLALAVLSMLVGVWGALVRLSWDLPQLSLEGQWIAHHGPLMVCGFLGTLIGVERAIAVGRTWAWLGPALSAGGAVVLILGRVGLMGPLAILASSALLVVVSYVLTRRQRAAFTWIMCLGAILWFSGNLLWVAGWAIHRVVYWWAGFLVLTILGERLALSRFRRQSRWGTILFMTAAGVLVAGLIVGSWQPTLGHRLLGLAILALSFWLFRYDMARQTLRVQGLPRFMAVCLLSGYIWLALAGVLTLYYPPMDQGLPYDAILHSLFVGFVLSMVFGHAPIIFPAVLGLPIPFRRRFYAHWFLLHTSLLLRIGSDAMGSGVGRQWGGLLNAVALVVFFVSTILSAVQGKRGEGST